MAFRGATTTTNNNSQVGRSRVFTPGGPEITHFRVLFIEKMASEVDAVATLTLKGTPLAELRVTDLKRELEHRGLSKSGSKSQLIERLKAQLLLEKLQQEAAQSSGDEHEGKVPNIALRQDDKAGQSEFVRQYLQQQQRNLEIQMEVKKQFEEESKRMSADESSADESRPTKVAADNPELTSAKQFKDDTSNAPAKEASKMPRPNRISNRNSVKGESGSVVDQVKNRPHSPKLDHARRKARSESSQSSRSPSPDRSSKNRRGRSTRTVVRKVERSRSTSSSSEEEIPKKKQRQGNNSSSRSGSRSPRPVSPKMLAQRSRRQSNADQVAENDLPQDGSGDKSAGRNENTDKTAVTSSRKKWRKKQPQAQAVSESANTNQRKESVAAATLGAADDTDERQKPHGEDTNSKDKVVGEYEQDVREVVSGAVLPTTTSNVGGQKVELEKGKLTFEEKQKHASKQKGEQDERIIEESSASAKGPQNSSRRQRSRSSSSDSSSAGSRSRSRSPDGKKGTGSGSSSSSSSDSESHTSGSSSDSSMDDSPKKASKASGEAQIPGRKPSQTQEKVDKVEEMEVEGTKNKSPTTRNTGRPEKDNNALSVQTSASGESKPKGQEEKQNNLDKEKESRPIEAKEKHGVELDGPPDDSSSGVAESLEKTKDADEEAAAKKGIKRRKWNSKASKAAKTTKRTSSMEISSDVLKNLIGDVKLTETVFEMETEVVNMLDYDDQEEDQRDVKVKKAQSPNKEEKVEEEDARRVEEEDARRVETRDASPESVEVPVEPEKKIIKLSSAAPRAGVKTKVKEGKKSKDEKKADAAGKMKKNPVVVVADKEANENVVSTNRIIKPLMPVVDEPEPVTGRQSPARNPPDRVIRIAGLVRPFTVNQLKELLRRSGELDDEYFYINDIKSHCLAAYKTQEQAAAARAALHGTRWPQSNPKILFVDFATIDDVMHRKQEGNVPLTAPVKRPQVEQKKIKEPKNVEKEEKKHKTKEPKEKSRVEREKEERETRDRKRDAEKKNFVREWDRDKVQQMSRSRSKSKERDRPVRRSRSRDREQRKRGDYNKEKKEEDRRKERKQKEAKADEEPPAKLLDDLFRKTKATPCIYWLPLTEEQAQQRLAKRLEEEKEQQKRIAAAEEREKEELRKRETARLERHRERDRAREKSRDKDRDRNRPERKASRSSSRSRSRRRR